MGTRSAAKIKLRTTVFKCDVCGRRLMSAEALKSHQEGVHNATAKVKTKTPVKSSVTKSKHQTPKLKNLKLAKIAIGKPKNATPKKATITPKPAAKTKNLPKTTSNSNSVVGANVQYECPKCMKTFPIYFSAHRHIQKCHCVNNAGDKVLPNSPDLIKPLKRDICIKCNKKIMAAEPHICENVKLPQDFLEQSWFYICAGCKQQFNSLSLFDLHVSGLHYKGVESMFFPSKGEFMEWKNEMEKIMKVRYSILGKTISKETYRCTFVPDGSTECDDRTSIVCPSTIIVQEFTKGVQVHFYKDHHEHKYQKYVLPDRYKKYSLTTLLENAEGYTQINELKVDENDLYLQFKKLMECIVLDAAKVNIKTLKVLIGKALEMTSVINTYEEDADSDSFSSKNAIDFNVSWVVGDKSAAEKRKVEPNEDKTQAEPITKRFKTRMYQHKPPESVDANASSPISTLQDSTIKIINSFSLADKDISKVVNEMDSESDTQSKSGKKEEESNSTSPLLDENVKDDLMTPIKEKKKLINKSSPSSFNDSYKDFVSKNFQLTPAPAKSKSRSKSNIAIPKAPQSKSVSPKAQIVPKELSKPQNVQKEPSKSNSKPDKPNKPNVIKSSKETLKPPKPENKPNVQKSPKEPLKANSKSENKSNVQKSPKEPKTPVSSQSLLPSKPETPISKPVDFKYEVKERENDCNILILKI